MPAVGQAAPPGRGVELDINLETERLFALLDGLAVHGAMRPADAQGAARSPESPSGPDQRSRRLQLQRCLSGRPPQ